MKGELPQAPDFDDVVGDMATEAKKPALVAVLIFLLVVLAAIVAPGLV